MSEGYIKIHRDTLQHWVATRADYLGAWTWMLMRASWKERDITHKARPVHLGRGQLLLSNRKFAECMNWSLGSAQRFLKLLVKEKMVEISKHESGVSIVTICNYAKFQSSESRLSLPRVSSESVASQYIRKKEEKEDSQHLPRGLPSFGLMEDIFDYVDGTLVITSAAERSRWEGLFGNKLNLDIALAGFAPDPEYRHGNSLQKHARHYLQTKCANVNRSREKDTKSGETYREKMERLGVK